MSQSKQKKKRIVNEILNNCIIENAKKGKSLENKKIKARLRQIEKWVNK